MVNLQASMLILIQVVFSVILNFKTARSFLLNKHGDGAEGNIFPLFLHISLITFNGRPQKCWNLAFTVC